MHLRGCRPSPYAYGTPLVTAPVVSIDYPSSNLEEQKKFPGRILI